MIRPCKLEIFKENLPLVSKKDKLENWIGPDKRKYLPSVGIVVKRFDETNSVSH